MSKHMKRLAAPKTLRIHRKGRTWTTKPSPGPHPTNQSIPLLTLVRDYLSLCDLQKEARHIISNGDILVDGQKRKNHKFPCGFMDVISIPVMKKDFRILFDRKGKLTLVPISTAEAEWKLCRIQDKSIISKGKIQLHLHDGNNTIVEKDQYKTGDVLRIAFADKKILDVYPFKKGTVSMITGGGHVGEIANIETIEVVASSKPNIAVMKTDKEFYTIVDYVFPIGVSQPVISLPEVKMA